MNRLHELDWFEALSKEAQRWVAEVVDAGVERFLWSLNNPGLERGTANMGLGAVPTAAAHAVSLGQTVELIRTAFEATEPVAVAMAAPGDEDWLIAQIGRYGREVAFEAALIYARVAEQRGAVAARQSSDLVDALIGDRSTAAVELLASRVGFATAGAVRAAACVPTIDPQLALSEVERAARKLDRHVLTALHEGLVIAIWATRARENALTVGRQLFGQHASAVVAGPASSVVHAGPAVRHAIAGLAARSARPNNREVLEAADLLPERSMLGERDAQDELIRRCYLALQRSGTGLLETVDAMFDHEGVLEQAARALPVHVNTLRYRLDKIAEVTGFDLRTSRGALAIYTGVSLGRMAHATDNTPTAL